MMKLHARNCNNVKEIIEQQLGIVDFESYKEYKESKSKENGGITSKDIELLHPDNIDNKKFWKYISKSIFEIDAICNIEHKEDKEIAINKANTNNFALGAYLGCFNGLLARGPKQSVLEIGCGFGGLRSFLEKTLAVDKYTGVDIYPLVDGILQVENDGTLPEEVLNQKFDSIVSSNVFQHLSITQRRNYYKQIKQILNPNGTFAFSNAYLAGIFRSFTTEEEKDGFVNFETNKKYMCHYGQFTEIQTMIDFQNDLEQAGLKILTRTYMNIPISTTNLNLSHVIIHEHI